MASVELNAQYESASALLTNGTKTTVLTCPAAPSRAWYVVTGINVCASAGVAGAATIIRYDSTLNREVYVRYQSVVPAVGSLAITDTGPWTLLPGDQIRVIGAADQHVDLSYMIGRPDPSNTFGQGVNRGPI